MNMKSGRSPFVVAKKDIEFAVNNSQRELKMLGTTAFDLPWQKNNFELYKSLFKKFSENNYEISIVAESDPTLYSDALVSGLSHNHAGVPIATLTETRQNSTLKLRSFFLSQGKGIAGLEPVDDSKRKQLDALYIEKFAKNVCKELMTRGHTYDNQFGVLYDDDNENHGILWCIQQECIERARAAFESSDVFSYYLKKRDYFSISRVSAKYEKSVLSEFHNKLEAIQGAEDILEQLFNTVTNGFSYTFVDDDEKKCSQKKYKFEISEENLRVICLNCILACLEKKEPRDYNLIREYASKEAYSQRGEKLKEFENDLEIKQRLIIKQIFHPIPVQMLKIDNVYYATLSPIPTFGAKEFLYVGDESLSAENDLNRYAYFDEYVHYFNTYMNSSYCTEETSKGNRKETIYNYSFDRSVLGQMPRDSFYGSDNYKLVMWALVFDRKGQILIHKRSNNAKDNQGMWDKSVGGHIAIKDRDIIFGASREIAEELYTIEEEEQGHTQKSGWMNINENKIIYLGKWNETRYPNFANNLHLESDEFYSFSFDSRMTDQPIDSMRVLPNGTHIKAKCFVNLYFVVASEEFDLSELKNSKYLVMEPSLIKECAKSGKISMETVAKIKEQNSELEVLPGRFETTPDLSYMINSPEWDNEITKFSIRVKEAFADKQ